MEWINVEDGLPKANSEGQKAFADFSAKVLVLLYGKEHIGFLNTSTGQWRVNGKNTLDVTHWTYLPARPIRNK